MDNTKRDWSGAWAVLAIAVVFYGSLGGILLGCKALELLAKKPVHLFAFTISMVSIVGSTIVFARYKARRV